MTSKQGDGVRKLKATADSEGRFKYELRLVARHPDRPQVKLVDTVRVVRAKNKADALTQRAQLIEDMLAQRLGHIRRGRKLTFAEAADEWILTIKRHATLVSWSSYARKLKAQFGDRPLEKIRTEEMQRFLASLPHARSTVKGYKAVLVSVYEWAIDQGYLPRPGAAAGLRMPKKSKEQTTTLDDLERTSPPKRGLTHEELSRFLPLLRSAEPHLYPLVLVQLVIGARFSEVSALKRRDVDMATGVLTVRRAQVYGRIGKPKNGKSRAAAVASTALAVLREHVATMAELSWPGWDEGWLFPAKPTRVRKFEPLWSISTARVAIKLAMAQAGASTVNATHFARHTLNGLIRGHVADSVLRTVVGHASEQQSAAYGDAQVIDFASTVQRIIMDRAGGGTGGSTASGEG